MPQRLSVTVDTKKHLWNQGHRASTDHDAGGIPEDCGLSGPSDHIFWCRFHVTLIDTSWALWKITWNNVLRCSLMIINEKATFRRTSCINEAAWDIEIAEFWCVQHCSALWQEIQVPMPEKFAARDWGNGHCLGYDDMDMIWFDLTMLCFNSFCLGQNELAHVKHFLIRSGGSTPYSFYVIGRRSPS